MSKETAVDKTAKKEDAESKEVATKQSSNAMAMFEGMADELEADAGLGKDFSSDMMVIPRVGIIQSLSPQRRKDSEVFIEGAEEGMIYIRNKAKEGTEGIKVIPCIFRLHYKEYEWENNRAGNMVKNHLDDARAYHKCENVKGKRFTSEGNVIMPVAEYFVFILNDDGTITRAILTMKNTQVNVAKGWNSDIKEAFCMKPDGTYIRNKAGQPISAPICYYVYHLCAMPQSNDKGTWFRWNVKFATTEDKEGNKRAMSVLDLPNGDEVYKQAKEFGELIRGEQYQVETEDTDVDEAVEEDDKAPM